MKKVLRIGQLAARSGWRVIYFEHLQSICSNLGKSGDMYSLKGKRKPWTKMSGFMATYSAYGIRVNERVVRNLIIVQVMLLALT